MSSSSLHEIKVVHFEAGSMILHANTTSGCHSISADNTTLSSCSSSNHNNRVLVGREIEGKLVLNLSMQSFVRGLWVKFIGSSMSTTEDPSGNVTIQSDDLFRGVSSSCGADEQYHLDGLHEVLLGYGEEVITTTSTTSTGESHVILQPGQHQWSFSLTLPSSAPASFFGDSSSITYQLVAVLDAYSEYGRRVTIEHDIIVLHYSHLRCLQLWDEVSNRR